VTRPTARSPGGSLALGEVRHVSSSSLNNTRTGPRETVLFPTCNASLGAPMLDANAVVGSIHDLGLRGPTIENSILGARGVFGMGGLGVVPKSIPLTALFCEMER
jgi:hypothetical protein